MMGTHVTVTADNGFKHTVEAVTVHDYGTSRKARFLDGVGAHGECDVTPAEYDRLAALLTGEGRIANEAEHYRKMHELDEGEQASLRQEILDLRRELEKASKPADFPCGWCGKELRGYDAKTRDGAPFLTLCNDGSESCSSRFDRTYFAGLHRAYDDIKAHRAPTPADPRTPGQVAYEGFYSDGCAAWSLVRPEAKARYEACAAAVMAHGRGLIYAPIEPAGGRVR